MLMEKLSLMKKHIDLIGFPSDLGASLEGCKLGPEKFRELGLVDRLQHVDHSVSDCGNLPVPHRHESDEESEKLRYISSIVETSEHLSEVFEESLDKGHTPICLGGDHSLSLGSLAGIASYCRKNDKSYAVLWIDAHSDMNTDETSPSGNIHGMPLAASLGYGHERLVGIHGFSPKLLSQNTYLFGVRDVDPLERVLVEKSGVHFYEMHKVHELGLQKILENEILPLKDKVDHVHVSFDIDGIDPEFVPGVGTPVADGLSKQDALYFMQFLYTNDLIDSMDVVELNPALDKDDKTAKLAIDILAAACGES